MALCEDKKDIAPITFNKTFFGSGSEGRLIEQVKIDKANNY